VKEVREIEEIVKEQICTEDERDEREERKSERKRVGIERKTSDTR
jgi:hypothetical protein